MSVRHLIGSWTILLAALTGCVPTNSPVSGPGNDLQGIPCSESIGTARVLRSGVVLSCRREKGLLLCTLRYDSAHKDIALERNAVVWAVADCPGVVLVHDCYASNEDRLFLIDLSRSPPREKEIVHDDWATYIHSHFAVIAEQGNRIAVQESQYAGDRPPRVRTIQVNLDSLSVSQVEPWQED